MSTSPVAMNLSNFRVVKHVTRPLLKMEPGEPYYIKIEGEFFQAEQVKNPKKVKQADGTEVAVPPPYVIHVIDLQNGVSSQMVANEVLKSELTKQYKDGSYVGKYFELIKNVKAEGKNYNTFGITELALVDETAASEATAKGTAKK